VDRDLIKRCQAALRHLLYNPYISPRSCRSSSQATQSRSRSPSPRHKHKTKVKGRHHRRRRSQSWSDRSRSRSRARRRRSASASKRRGGERRKSDRPPSKMRLDSVLIDVCTDCIQAIAFLNITLLSFKDNFCCWLFYRHFFTRRLTEFASTLSSAINTNFYSLLGERSSELGKSSTCSSLTSELDQRIRTGVVLWS